MHIIGVYGLGAIGYDIGMPRERSKSTTKAPRDTGDAQEVELEVLPAVVGNQNGGESWRADAGAAAKNSPKALDDLWRGSKTLPDTVREALANAKAITTKRAYQSDWRIWLTWCDEHGHIPVPADPVVVAEFLTAESKTFKISTVTRRSAALATLHRLAGFDSPCRHPLVTETLNGLRRMNATEPVRKSKAMTGEALKEIVTGKKTSNNEIKLLRDRALLLIGYSAAMRRSELVLIEYEHITRVKQGIEILIPYSKTDQLGEGIVKRIPYGLRKTTCPIRALEAWLEASGIEEAWVFRPVTKSGKVQERPLSDRAIATIVKQHAIAAGIDGSLEMAGHSLRSGAATTAAVNGASLAQLLQLGSWKDTRTALRYIQQKEAWENVAGEKLGL